MFSFLKTKRHESRGFNYKPRFYDSEKELMRAKVKEAQLKEEGKSMATEEKELLKYRIREELRHAKSTARRDMRGLWQGGSFRLIIILVALIAFAYYVLNRFLPVFLQMFFPEG